MTLDICPSTTHPAPTSAELCDHINRVARQIARLDAVLGRITDEMHRTTIARATLLVQKSELIGRLHIAETLASARAAKRLPARFHARIPDDLAEHKRVVHLDRETSQISEETERFDEQFSGRS